MTQRNLAPVWPSSVLVLTLLLGLSCGPDVDPAEKAAAHFAARRYAEAEEIYRQLFGDHPEDSGLLVSLAGCLGALERYDEAEGALGQALGIDPSSPEVHHNLGALAQRRGDPKQAAAHYARALELHPGYAPSHRSLARLEAGRQQPVPSTPEEAQAAALAEQAREAAAAQQIEKALALLDKAAAIAPSFVLIHQYRANILFLSGRRMEAIAALEKGLAHDPDNALLRSNLDSLTREGDASQVPFPDPGPGGVLREGPPDGE